MTPKAGSRARARRSLAAARRRRPAAARVGAVVAAVAALIAALLLGLAKARGTGPGTPAAGPQGVPVPAGRRLAAPDADADGQPVDGVACQTGEQVAYHIHVHLAVFVDGRARQIPPGIGIAAPRRVQSTQTGVFVSGGACFYWLHTHAADGIVHVESPSLTSYTLGDFFDVWRQPLSAAQVGPEHGPVTVFLDGHRSTVDPRDIVLAAHRVIQLDVGTPTPAPRPVVFPSGL